MKKIYFALAGLICYAAGAQYTPQIKNENKQNDTQLEIKAGVAKLIFLRTAEFSAEFFNDETWGYGASVLVNLSNDHQYVGGKTAITPFARYYYDNFWYWGDDSLSFIEGFAMFSHGSETVTTTETVYNPQYDEYDYINHTEKKNINTIIPGIAFGTKIGLDTKVFVEWSLGAGAPIKKLDYGPEIYLRGDITLGYRFN